MKTIIKILFFALVILIITILVNTLRFTPQEQHNEKKATINIDTTTAKYRLAKLLQFQTISNKNKDALNTQPFEAMQQYLQTTFPEVFKTLEVQQINQHSLLLKWPGSQPQLKPALFLAHQDVVPVDNKGSQKWTHPPFSGVVDDKFIWGRGAQDDKASLMGILEAVNALLQQGFTPKRSIYLAFGHDEEVGGEQGAAQIAQHLKRNNVELEFVLDEGGLIAKDLIPGVKPLVALIGVAEKGYLSLELSVKTEGGHSSIPPQHTAVGILSQAIVDLENNPFPVDPTHMFRLFDQIGPHLSFGKRMIFANSWLTKPLIIQQLSQRNTTNAMLRTTTAATIFDAGVKDNVLPRSAKAIVNIRILPGETIASVKQTVRKIINNPNIEINGVGREPSKLSSHTSNSFTLLKNTIYQANNSDDQLVISPYLVTGGTDARYFENLTENVYRFLFNYADPDDIKRIHSVDERISIDNYNKIIRFYYLMMKNTSSL